MVKWIFDAVWAQETCAKTVLTFLAQSTWRRLLRNSSASRSVRDTKIAQSFRSDLSTPVKIGNQARALITQDFKILECTITTESASPTPKTWCTSSPYWSRTVIRSLAPPCWVWHWCAQTTSAGLWLLDTILRMAAEWECAQIMTERGV